MSFSFTVDAMVHGYGDYQSVWQASLGENLKCVREVGNRSDVFALAVVKAGETVGHLPRKISSICSIFLRNGGDIVCDETGLRRHSRDLPQGGLEVPCELKFVGSSKDTTKAKKLIDSSMLYHACTVITTSRTLNESEDDSEDD